MNASFAGCSSSPLPVDAPPVLPGAVSPLPPVVAPGPAVVSVPFEPPVSSGVTGKTTTAVSIVSAPLRPITSWIPSRGRSRRRNALTSTSGFVSAIARSRPMPGSML